MNTNCRKSWDIYIQSWSAWQPRLCAGSLSTSYVDGLRIESEHESPVLDGIPAMKRRRLSPLARVAFHALGQCAKISENEPVVFSSRMGEIQRTQGILESVANETPVSPTAFGLSVHNAIAGQWSTVHGITAPMIALSSLSGSSIAALLEALGLLQESTYTAVNVVLYEEDYPAFYSPFLKGPSAPMALALRLVTGNLVDSKTVRLSLSKSMDGPQDISRVAYPLDLLPLLDGTLQTLQVIETQSQWQVECLS